MSGKVTHVEVTVRLSQSAIRLLDAHIGLSGGYDRDERRDIAGALACVITAEAHGATEEQVHQYTPMEFRNDIEIQCDKRTPIYEETDER